MIDPEMEDLGNWLTESLPLVVRSLCGSSPACGRRSTRRSYCSGSRRPLRPGGEGAAAAGVTPAAAGLRAAPSYASPPASPRRSARCGAAQRACSTGPATCRQFNQYVSWLCPGCADVSMSRCVSQRQINRPACPSGDTFSATATTKPISKSSSMGEATRALSIVSHCIGSGVTIPAAPTYNGVNHDPKHRTTQLTHIPRLKAGRAASARALDSSPLSIR